MKAWRFVVLGIMMSTALGVAQPARAVTSYYCSDIAPPCVESATRDGTPVTSTDPDFQIVVSSSTASGSNDILWNLTRPGDPDPYELGAAERSVTWNIVLDTGTVLPRVSFVHGDDTITDRTKDGDDTFHISITANPTFITGECDQSSWPWTCPETSDEAFDRDGYLDGQVTDYGAWSDATQRASMWGMNYATNVSATSLPPEIENDPSTGAERLLIRLANPHYRFGGALFEGFVHLRIPNAFLRAVYGIDYPASMTGSSLTANLSGSGAGTTTITQESGDDAMLVDATGLTFSARSLRVKQGIIVPTKPTHLRAKRLSRHRGRVAFTASRPRGSKITGYKVRCSARRGTHVLIKTFASSPVWIYGLRRAVGYDCRVKGISKAGPGPFSAAVKIPARP